MVREIPHDSIRRDGDDLVMGVGVPLATALCEGKIDVPALDGRTLRVPLKEVVYSGYERTVVGEGMPKSRMPGQKGNLRIHFKVTFPSRQLSGAEASQLHALLDKVSGTCRA